MLDILRSGYPNAAQSAQDVQKQIDALKAELAKLEAEFKECLKKCTPPPAPAPTTGATPSPPATPPPPPKKVCAACQAIADKISGIDESIAKLERSQASFRKNTDLKGAALENALKADDAKITDLKVQKAKLEAELEGCKKTCGDTSWNGFHGGAQFVAVWSHLDTTEYNADTGEPTNHLHDCCSGVGGGFHIGYDRLISESVLIGAVIGANYMNDVVKHRFANGSSIGATMNATASLQARAGFLVMPDLLIYGQGGASIANQELRIAFGGPRTSTSKVTSGLTIGGGVEYLLPASLLGTSTSLFAGYEHSFWEKAKLTMPTASPFFNYKFQRDSDTVKLGIRFRFGS